MFGVLKKTFEEFLADNCFRMAAALAYHAIFAIAPLLVLVILLLGFVLDAEQVTEEVERQMSQIIGQDGAAQVRSMIVHMQETPKSVSAMALGVAAILLGATGLMVELQTSLNEAWGVKPPATRGHLSMVMNLVVKRVLSFAMILSIAFVLLVSMLLSAVITLVMRYAQEWVGGGQSATLVLTLDFAAVFVVYILLFAAIFQILPDVKVAWRDALVGGVFTAVCFMAGRYAIGAYLGNQNMASTYGAGASLVLVLLWIYYSALIVLLGAEFTQVWSCRRSGKVAK